MDCLIRNLKISVTTNYDCGRYESCNQDNLLKPTSSTCVAHVDDFGRKFVRQVCIKLTKTKKNTVKKQKLFHLIIYAIAHLPTLNPRLVQSKPITFFVPQKP